METALNFPRVVSSGHGTTFNILGHAVTVKLHSWDGNGNYIFEMTFPPGSGIPPHVHNNEDEFLYIVAGEFEVMIGGEAFKATAGDCLNFVRHSPHAYTNTGMTDAKTLWYISPGGSFEEFFDQLSQFPAGPPDQKALASLCEQHGMKFL